MKFTDTMELNENKNNWGIIHWNAWCIYNNQYILCLKLDILNNIWHRNKCVERCWDVNCYNIFWIEINLEFFVHNIKCRRTRKKFLWFIVWDISMAIDVSIVTLYVHCLANNLCRLEWNVVQDQITSAIYTTINLSKFCL